MEQTIHRLWPVLTVEERADRAEKRGADTLHRCPDPWAIRQMFVNEQTGEVIRARCNRWECLYCGPRKVDLWRQLVKEADPVLFLTLTKAGRTVEQAARAFQTFIQALRRGSKGRGSSHLGARVAYPVEYFAVLERHSDFERNGFHWHVLLKGVDRISYKEVIQPLWMSATHYNEQTGEGAMIADIQRIRNAKAIGYVTKYLTKAIAVGEKGTKQVQKERGILVDDDLFGVRYERQMVTEEVVSKARRIRYSRHFFPERVATLREKLFSGMEEQAMEPCEGASDGAVVVDEQNNSLPIEEDGGKQPSGWRLVEREIKDFVDIEEYKRARYTELADGLAALREVDPGAFQKRKREMIAQVAHESRVLVGGVYDMLKRRLLVEALSEDRPLSRRVISMWDYQRKQLRLVG